MASSCRALDSFLDKVHPTESGGQDEPSPAARIGKTRAHIVQSVVDGDLEFAHVLKVPIKWFLDDEADVRAKLD